MRRDEEIICKDLPSRRNQVIGGQMRGPGGPRDSRPGGRRYFGVEAGMGSRPLIAKCARNGAQLHSHSARQFRNVDRATCP